MTSAAGLCVVLAALSVALWVPASPRRLLIERRVTAQRGTGRPVTRADAVATSDRAGPGRRPLGRLGTASPREPAVLRALTRVRAGWRGRSAESRRRSQVIELCAAMGSELRAGAMPQDALATAVRSVPELCDEAGRAAALGGDAVEALQLAARQPGAQGLGRLAAAWSVTELTGSGLADGCERVAGWLRDEESLRREVSAQLAGARSSARMLTALPLLGLALGSGIGGDPVGFLLGTPYGLACFAGGVTLLAAGLWWTERLARSVESEI